MIELNPEINEITEDMGLMFRKTLLERSGPVNYNTAMRHLKVLFKYPIKRGYLQAYPFEDIPKTPISGLKPRTIALNDMHQAIAWLDGIESSDEFIRDWTYPGVFWRSFLIVLFRTGMRYRQIVNLEWSDIDFKHNIIMLRAKNSKNRREWKIPLHPEVAQSLKSLFRYTKENLLHTLRD